MKSNRLAALFFSAAWLLILNPLFAQTPRVAARLTYATVFANRAQLTSTLKTTLEAGTTELIIDNIADQLDPQSIQLSGKGDVVILGVTFNQNFLQNAPKSRPVQLLEDSLKLYREQLANLVSARDVVQQEKDLLIANRQVGGTQGGATIEKIQQMSEFFRRRMTELNAQLQRNDQQQASVKERITKIQGQLTELAQRRTRPTGELRVSLSAKTRTTADLELRYVALNAGWSPTYDLRASNVRGPIQLLYKASVYQQTGLEWENIRLTLSSANPSVGGQAPELSPQFVDFYRPRPMPTMRSNVRQKSAEAAEATAAPAPMVSSMADITTTVENALSVSFEIPIPYSIPSGDNPKVVDIQRAELTATYRHLAVPKLDADAFLLADVSGWERYNLLPGKASVYFEGTFVGESFLNPQNPDDSLHLSLGRDRKVLVKREPILGNVSRKSSGERESRAFRIT
ncbi:MAG: mucoidy inhibitor MuiA family protein, partial [Cytophagaceae bacterium]|nr:mucoidy inhibitor MuiA family protein [Cytophagaceae bacterium]